MCVSLTEHIFSLSLAMVFEILIKLKEIVFVSSHN
jgi:hypothetical protein